MSPSGPTIDADFRPELHPAVVAVPVKDEAVLYDELTGKLHELDSIATLVCSLWDGRTSISAAVDELTAAFNAEREVIERDVVALVEHLAEQGLLVGYESEPATRTGGLEPTDAC